MMLSRSRRVVLAGLTALLGAAAGLALVEIGMRYYAGYVQSREHMDPGLLVYDPQLGWRMAPGWSGRHRHYDFDVRYTLNAEGLRGRAFSEPPLSGQRRVVVVGDSFTFGLGVDDDDTFVARLAAADPETAYLNAGIAGYSTDQQLLYLRDRLRAWRADRLVLVVYLANDLLDNTLRFPLQAEMGKPLLVVGTGGDLVLTNVPVPLQAKPPEERARTLASMVLGAEVPRNWRNQWQLSQALGLGESADPDVLVGMPERLAAPVDLFVRLVGELRALCADNGVAPTLVLMPGRSYVELPDSVSAAFQEELRRQVLARQGDLRMPTVDLAAALRGRHATSGMRLFHPNEGHLDPTGHRVVAELLQSALAGDPHQPEVRLRSD